MAFLEMQPRDFNPMSASGLTKEARDSVNAALKSLSAWRNELAETNEKNGKRVIDQMAAAATALGWPEQVVDTARTQLQSIAEIQIKTMDQLMDAWEEQIKLPNPMTASPSAMLSKLQSLPGLGSAQAPKNPLELWMQFAEQWQRTWGDALGAWGKRH
jgi:ribonuclease D